MTIALDCVPQQYKDPVLPNAQAAYNPTSTWVQVSATLVPRRPVKWREPSDVSPVARDVIARVYKATRDTPGS